MVEIFKTNVEGGGLAEQLVSTLHDRFPSCKVNFDLDDCDRILRVEGGHVCPESIVDWMKSHGYFCEVLN